MVVNRVMMYFVSKCQISKDGNDFVCQCGTANCGANDDVHALLRVCPKFIVDREQLENKFSIAQDSSEADIRSESK